MSAETTLTCWGLASCDTCRKARKALEAAGRAAEWRDVRADGAPPAKLADWLARAGVEALINRRSTTWRGLSAEEKAAAMTEEGAARILAAHPTLMKRPVIEAGDALHVGWSDKIAARLI